jgi:tRNA-specific 2-thiouridylase
VAGAPPHAGVLAAKTRYRQADARCTLVPAAIGEGFTLDFEAAQWAVTPGQSAVLYDGEVCQGGGVIDSATLTSEAAPGAEPA